MRILICDDNLMFSEQLEHLITEFFKKNKLQQPEICIYQTGEALLSDSGEKDLVFLDIEMPGRSGIFVGRQLSATSPHTIIIVITSFTEYLDDAMRFHVFRYLSKPLDAKRLFRNLSDAMREFADHMPSAKLLVETKGISVGLSPNEIICIESQNRSIIIHSIKGDYETLLPMSHWLEELSSPLFFQSHRSYIVNLSHVLQFDKDSIQLKDNHNAYLARRKYTAFKKAYLLFLEYTR